MLFVAIRSVVAFIGSANLNVERRTRGTLLPLPATNLRFTPAIVRIEMSRDALAARYCPGPDHDPDHEDTIRITVAFNHRRHHLYH